MSRKTVFPTKPYAERNERTACETVIAQMGLPMHTVPYRFAFSIRPFRAGSVSFACPCVSKYA